MVITTVAIIVPLAAEWLVRDSGLRVLFVRRRGCASEDRKLKKLLAE
jgi:hypothetical protein